MDDAGRSVAGIAESGRLAQAATPAPSPRPARPAPALPRHSHEATEQRSEQLDTSAVLATAGGFLDAFTYFGHGHVFANAMTGNVVLLGVDVFSSKRWSDSLRHLLPIIMFLLGIWGARALQLGGSRRRLPSAHLSVLAFEIATISVLAFLPPSTGDFWITCSIAFAASMQVQTFRNVDGYSYNSTFMTGNLRMLSVGLFDWCFDTGKPDARHSARVFATIAFGFLVGAIAGGFSVQHLRNHALLFEVALLVLALARVLALGDPPIARDEKVAD